ncbi:FMN-dependent NADH-azoreductase [Pseudoxanthomonas broegbernensis]|uniref:FMN dependent NADH:quinone oxidoreductase n=1 Tax=Pseudoxanthomonas broegbernensis TaxID=83619 RepID=A0A7V8GQH4_9GAMM|nr:NAD(P)H-dependent oxidoreductase [Pseudoxanthomonas broegbernensis]KAF1688224.1 FMN-dependent NADH-azoreductase [Pseudoxanthomonas broegbernensis]MBB6065121.1 FMN-dependent NADH-azoreductase [Pseudoxanthomonas broegbernensis]
MKLLHIDSSALGAQSVTRDLSAAIVAHWSASVDGLRLEYRDLDRDPLPHLTAGSLAKADPEQAAEAERTLDQFLQADVVVIGAPMYNFTIPSTLKAWIDRIAVAGRTFRYTENGPQGLAGGKRVIVASGRGGVHTGAATDFQEPYLRQLFAFLGVEDVEFVRAEGVAYSPQHRADALAAARASIPSPRPASEALRVAA